ncbi:MAG TPA: MoaD/ThiS family protein [Pseudomonadales bacterium]|nr:MoaD/ThiS family protein [Pseudomonadales bacterium]
MIRIKYFAKYREWMQMSEEVLDVSPEDIGKLKRLIRDKHTNALKILDDPRCIVAVNQQIVHGDGVLLKSGDEVAFYPPVTGG